MNENNEGSPKEKHNVGPKFIGSGFDKDRRLSNPKDIMITKIMCEACWKRKKEYQKK